MSLSFGDDIPTHNGSSGAANNESMAVVSGSETALGNSPEEHRSLIREVIGAEIFRELLQFSLACGFQEEQALFLVFCYIVTVIQRLRALEEARRNIFIQSYMGSLVSSIKASMRMEKLKKENKAMSIFITGVCWIFGLITKILTVAGGVMFLIISIAVLLFFLVNTLEFVADGNTLEIVRQIIWSFTMIPVVSMILSIACYMGLTLREMSFLPQKGDSDCYWRYWYMQKEFKDEDRRYARVSGVIFNITIGLTFISVTALTLLTVYDWGFWAGVVVAVLLYIFVYSLFLLLYFPIRTWFIICRPEKELPAFFKRMDWAFLLNCGDGAGSWISTTKWMPNAYTSWRSFLHPMDTEMKKWRNGESRGVNMWSAIVVVLLVIVEIILDIVIGFQQTSEIKKLGGEPVWWNYAFMLLRAIIYIYMAPSMASYNVVQCVRRMSDKSKLDRSNLCDDTNTLDDEVWDALKDNDDYHAWNTEKEDANEGYKSRKVAKWSTLAGIVICTVQILVLIVGSVVMNIFTPVTIDEYHFNGNLEYKYVTETAAAPLCNTEIHGWTPLELAGLTALAHVPRGQDELLSNLTNEIFRDNHVPTLEPLTGELTPGYLASREGSSPVIVLDGVREKRQIGYLLENVVFHYEPILLTWVPFMNMVYNPMKTFIQLISVLLYTGLVGPRAVSRLVAVDMDNIIKDYQTRSSDLPVVTGHMSGAMTAKYASVKYGFPSFSFESPSIAESTISSMVVEMKLAPTDIDDLMSRNRELIYNWYSGSSLFSFVEAQTRANTKLPDYQSWTKPANVYETFCLIAAGCVSKNEYDEFCSKAVGREKYLSYFDSWNRTRINDV